MYTQKNKGFTLIELLVVVAIIGILSAVALASLSSARQKGNDGAIKSAMANFQAQAQVDADKIGGDAGPSYASTALTTGTCPNPATDPVNTNVFNTKDGNKIAKNVYNNSGTTYSSAKCYATKDTYVWSVPLRSETTKFWCIDNSGNAVTLSTQLSAADLTTCQ